MKAFSYALTFGLLMAGSPAAESASGKRAAIVVTTADSTMTIDPESGKQIHVIRPAIPGSVSPDGTRVAHVKTVRIGSSTTDELFVSNIDREGKRSNERQITNGAGNAMQPQWMPDGRQIVYVCGEGKFQQVYITSADNDKWTETRASEGGVRSLNPRVAPDGTIAYLAERGKDGKATLVDLIVVKDGKPDAIVKNTAIKQFAWSPDSTRIAYSAHGELTILTIADKSFTTRTYQSIDERLYAHHASALAWRPDGKAIAASIQFSGGIAIMPGQKPQPGFGEHDVFIIPLDGDVKRISIGARPRDLTWTKS